MADRGGRPHGVCGQIATCTLAVIVAVGAAACAAGSPYAPPPATAPALSACERFFLPASARAFALDAFRRQSSGQPAYIARERAYDEIHQIVAHGQERALGEGAVLLVRAVDASKLAMTALQLGDLATARNQATRAAAYLRGLEEGFAAADCLDGRGSP